MPQLPQNDNPGLELIREDLAAVVAALGPAAEMLAGKTVLLTGANGFLPAYLADVLAYLNEQALAHRPAQLILLVRQPVGPGSRLAHLQHRADVQFLVQDVCAPLQLDRAPHFMIHAASPASPQWYRADPVGTLDANSVGLRQLLELARRGETESMLYFSSSEVYGSPAPEHIPTPETYRGTTEFTGKRACYIEGKRFGESLCGAFFEQYGVPVKVVRPFHIHGPGLRIDDGRVIPALIAMGLEQQPFELLSDGRATRTYGYVSDATLGFLKVLLSNYNGEAFNVGADAPETSILELATLIARIFGREETVKVNASPRAEHLQGAPERVCPDLTKIRQLLGYISGVGLEEGLRRTVRWHQLRHARLKGAPHV